MYPVNGISTDEKIATATQPQTFTTLLRPDPTEDVPVGAMIYDTDLDIPLWSDGLLWNDAAGMAV